MDNYSAIEAASTLIDYAIRSGASDIHIQPEGDRFIVRLRVHGVLVQHAQFTSPQGTQLVARIKILAGVDVAERRLPQDGKFSQKNAHAIVDFRVATYPTPYGESCVIRILDRHAQPATLTTLGMPETVLPLWDTLIHQHTGLCLVTGPTGSGKTTTLYATLAAIVSPHINIITLEDPIEYTMSGMVQSQINPEIGFTFARGMRALLRQDPDVIFIGEMRDAESASIAMQAALTGHLVFSTLHTNDTASTIIRLMEMGIPAYLINATVIGVLAQQLVRTLCTMCKIAQPLNASEHAYVRKYALPITESWVAPGCASCAHTGIGGRTGVFELLRVTHALRELIVQQPDWNSISAQAIQDGTITMRTQLGQLAKAGTISIAECIRLIA